MAGRAVRPPTFFLPDYLRMPELKETIYAPELVGGEWLQGGPVSLRALRGKAIVLIDFWDYTCVNCIRTLPYVAQWHQRYAPAGLLIAGVHAPEFQFARDRAHVEAAIADFGLRYPVVLDNHYEIWRAYSNRCWPAKYLVDSQGRIRYLYLGEGSYDETERQIQRLLRELGSGVELPALMEPVRDSDKPGAVCYRVTPELYLGYGRGQFGNPEGIRRDTALEYRDPGHHAEGLIYLGGRWRVSAEFARAEAAGASIGLSYTAKEVNLVLAPPPGAASCAELAVEQGERAGKDAQGANDRALLVTVDRPRMYNLVANPTVNSASLSLRALEGGLSAYAFTFVSCAVT